MSTKGRIVVIDDEVNAATALEALLRDDGYDVARAHDARSGLQLIEKSEPDVVLTDVRMRVRDTGPGLPENLDVFQLFVTTKARGTGLGLSIAQQIVLEHGGVLTAESEPGKGATFTVTLPLRPGADRAEEMRA